MERDAACRSQTSESGKTAGASTKSAAVNGRAAATANARPPMRGTAVSSSQPSPRSRAGRHARFCPGDCRTPWMPGSASRLCRRGWPDTAGRRSSTSSRIVAPVARRKPAQTRAASSPAAISPAHSRTRMWPSPWTAGADAWTTFSGLTPRHWRDDHCEVIERLWRSLKYEAVYLHDLTDCFHAKRVIGEWIDFYNPVSQHPSVYAVEVNRFC